MRPGEMRPSERCWLLVLGQHLPLPWLLHSQPTRLVFMLIHMSPCILRLYSGREFRGALCVPFLAVRD